MTIRALIIVVMLSPSVAVVSAETLTCNVWQGIRTCLSANGYVSHETEWQGRTYGSDNRGDAWSTSHWNGFDITTVKPSNR